jgi:hypothetical protein
MISVPRPDVVFPSLKNRLKIVLGLLLVFMVLTAGCATTYRIYSSVVPEKSGLLKKRILVLPILDQAALGDDKIKSIESVLISTLTKDGNVVVIAAFNPGTPSDKTRLPRYGIVIDPDQAKRADQMGMNVLVTAFISPLDYSSKKSGIWPFRKVKHEAEISMVVNAFDVITGTLFLSHIESRKIRAEVDSFEEGQEGQASKPEIEEKSAEKALNQIVEAQASAVSVALRGQPWSGRILSAGSEGVTISAGKDVGLTVGTLFEVYGMGEPIRSADGTSLIPLGIKVGEVKVMEVMESEALAKPINNGLFSPGQVIRVKG